MVPSHDSTLPPVSITLERLADAGVEVPALVILWSRHEPHRTGEAALVPDDDAWILGRGEAGEASRASPPSRRLVLFRQRPGTLTARAPLQSPRISREQLRVRTVAGGLAVENSGRCPMLVQGREVARAVVAPGDVIELRHELLLYCTTRHAKLPDPSAAPAGHPFGAPDAHGLVGESPAMWRVRGAIAAAARRALHVLVQGPSGSGKELVARALHAESARAPRTLVARNAATIPEGLVDAELFGNLRNYPNPGMPERPGLVGQADGSTLFLDEIAELPAVAQAHLLRVLDEGDYHRLGEATARRSDFRLVGATNRPESALKYDLLARLKIRISTPGLDERREDVPHLCATLMRAHAAADPTLAARFFPEGSIAAEPRLSPDLVLALVRHRYTTHVRELDTLLLAAATDSHGKYVDLTEGVRRRLTPETKSEAPGPKVGSVFTEEEQARLALQRAHGFRATDCGRDPAYPGNRQTADLHLRQLVCRALPAAGWEVGAAAALLAGTGAGELNERALSRIETFLRNLERRLDGPSSEAIVDEWRGGAELLPPVIEALREGRIRGRARS